MKGSAPETLSEWIWDGLPMNYSGQEEGAGRPDDFESWMQLLVGGDQAAFASFFERYSVRVFRLLLVLLFRYANIDEVGI